MSENVFAEVIVDNKARSTDMGYTYLVPQEYREEIAIGMRVLVPFGRGNKLLEAIIINIKDKCNINSNRLKYIDSIIDNRPIISREMLELALWMKDEYLAQYIDVFRTIIPSGITNKVKKYLQLNPHVDFEIIKSSIQSKHGLAIVEYLREKGDTDVKTLRNKLNIKNIHSAITSLENEGFIGTYEKIETDVKKKYQKVVFRTFDDSEVEYITNQLSSRATKQIEAIKELANYKSIPLAELLQKLSTSRSTVTALEKKGLVKVEDQEVKRNPITKSIPKYHKVTLNKEQKICVDTIYEDTIHNRENKFLIHGITGSGKTEVYLQLIEKMLEHNKQSIVLVPEISLTPQTVERFVGRFGNRVAVLHSRLSLGERFDEWQKIREGEVDIVVGARSAIFAPFKNLGLIIIDEEHETSYKSSMNPKYNTLEVAEKRCELEGSSLLLGSATPLVETYYRAKKGEIKLLTLLKRANNSDLPPIEVVDMKDELEKGNKSIFSATLYHAMKDNLERKKQTILFLNRRGFSTFISCRKCGYVAKCKDCDISLTYHRSKHILQCHYCGLAEQPPTICPECGSKYIKYFGIGTQKVEEIVRKHFPEAKVARMDVDTTAKKGSHERILDTVKSGEVDILIGTQMISKGLDFPNVTLVGIIAADISLNLPNFKSSERTFQLITQVGGRAGRGKDEGMAVLQTYEPRHYSITTAQYHDYISFYDQEILLRRDFDYPPFTNIINITVIGKNEREVARSTKYLASDIVSEINKRNIQYDRKKLLGPNPAPIARIKNKYRWQVVFKCNDFEIDKLKDIIEYICITDLSKEKYENIRFSIDINPISIM